MDDIELLVVGPANRTTGGIARFLSEQRRRLPSDISVRVYDGGTTSTNHLNDHLVTVLVTLWAMVRFPFRRRPDLVHVHTSHRLAFYRASWYVLVARLVWQRPVVIHIHGSSFDEFARADSLVAAWMQRMTFGLADRVISLSEYWQSVLSERIDATKLVVVPNAVDPNEYEPSYGADPPVAVFISNHIERKGIRELVAAIEQVDETDLHVRIAGSGPLSSLAETLAAESPNVEYYGYVSEAEKRRLIQEATVYLLPTYAEGLPIALLEGMAGGNAVITTNVAAIPEVVDDASGWTVPPGDIDALGQALSEFAADPDAAVEMGRHNRSIIEDRFAWPAVIDRLTDIYRSIATPR